MRRWAVVLAAALAATAAVAAGGKAGAQAVADVVVLPATADPGSVVIVSNGSNAPCPPPGGSGSPSASVDLYAPDSATPANRVPYQGAVSGAGAWSVEVRLAPDLPPGQYRVQAGCYTDSGLNSGFGPTYRPGRLDLRLQRPGRPSPAARRAGPGETIEVTSGEARCTPPAGSPSPRVRVSLLDANKATRAEAEGPVDPPSGRWTVGLRVPDIPAQTAEITAVCLARVGAPAPYARYGPAAFAVEAAQAGPPPTAPVTTTPIPPATAPPGEDPNRPTPTSTPAAVSLPPTPLALPVVAEPTYTG